MTVNRAVRFCDASSHRGCFVDLDILRRGIDLFRTAEVIEVKGSLAPRVAKCRWCGRHNYHLKNCARSVRLARTRPILSCPRTGQHVLPAPIVIDAIELRWCYLLELAQRELANPGAAMP